MIKCALGYVGIAYGTIISAAEAFWWDFKVLTMLKWIKKMLYFKFHVKIEQSRCDFIVGNN